MPSKEPAFLPNQALFIKQAQNFYKGIVCAAYYGVEKHELAFKGAANLTQFLNGYRIAMYANLEQAGVGIEVLSVALEMTPEQVKRALESAFLVAEKSPVSGCSATHHHCGDARIATKELMATADFLRALPEEQR